jgi:hypothetical protein
VDRFDDKGFRANYDTLITRIHKVSPNAAIIFETNNDSFRMTKRKRYVQHPNGEVARKSFFILADKYKAGVWDKFSIMGGLGPWPMEKRTSPEGQGPLQALGLQPARRPFLQSNHPAYQDHIANLPALEPEAPETGPPRKPTPRRSPPKTKNRIQN